MIYAVPRVLSDAYRNLTHANANVADALKRSGNVLTDDVRFHQRSREAAHSAYRDLTRQFPLR